MVRVRWGRTIPRDTGMFYPSFNSNNFAGSAALAKVCVLLSAVLVFNNHALHRDSQTRTENIDVFSLQ